MLHAWKYTTSDLIISDFELCNFLAPTDIENIQKKRKATKDRWVSKLTEWSIINKNLEPFKYNVLRKSTSLIKLMIFLYINGHLKSHKFAMPWWFVSYSYKLWLFFAGVTTFYFVSLKRIFHFYHLTDVCHAQKPLLCIKNDYLLYFKL